MAWCIFRLPHGTVVIFFSSFAVYGSTGKSMHLIDVSFTSNVVGSNIRLGYKQSLDSSNMFCSGKCTWHIL